MSTSPKNDERWTPLQALAWVATRDQSLVEEIGRGYEGEAMTPTWLIVAAKARLGISLNLDASWKQLTAHIAAGDIHADGQPCLPASQPEHRQRLTIEARDLDIEIDRHGIDQGCVLIGEGTEQRSWYRVKISTSDLVQKFPSFQNKGRIGGRKPTYDRDVLSRQAHKLLEHHGIPDPLDKEFPSQNSLVEQLQDFCLERFGKEPARSTLQGLVKAVVAEHIQRRSQHDLSGRLPVNPADKL